MAWTDERVEKLKQLWEEGKSASEIAKELGNVTRNAVIGKVHRMGLQSRTAGAEPKKEEPKKPRASKSTAAPESKSAQPTPKPAKSETKVEKPSAEVETAEDAEVADASNNQFPAMVPANNDEISEETRRNVERMESSSKRLTLMQLTERTCKWPVGDPATDDFWFCGHPSEAGKPYCQAHVELAFQAPMARRRS